MKTQISLIFTKQRERCFIHITSPLTKYKPTHDCPTYIVTFLKTLPCAPNVRPNGMSPSFRSRLSTTSDQSEKNTVAMEGGFTRMHRIPCMPCIYLWYLHTMEILVKSQHTKKFNCLTVCLTTVLFCWDP